MSVGLEPYVCTPCRRSQHTQCRGQEWACDCPHVRFSAPAPAAPVNPSAVPSDVGTEAAGGVAGGVRGSAPPATPFDPAMFDPAWLPSFWGGHGCRFASRPGHVCRTSFGQPIEIGQCCFSEARAALRDDLSPEHGTWAVGE